MTTFRFRDFELDVAACELRRAGQPLRIERQPMDLLILLVERRHELVSRDDIVKRLWGERAFADVEADPKWDALRSQARFRDLIQRCGFERPDPVEPG